MNCPKCGYVSFDHLDECKNCGQNLLEHKAKLGIKSFSKREPSPETRDIESLQEPLPPSQSETAIEEEVNTTDPESHEDDIFSLDDISFEEGLGGDETDEDYEIEIDIAGSDDSEKEGSEPEEDPFFPDDQSVNINDDVLASDLDIMLEKREADDEQQSDDSETQNIDIIPEHFKEDQESEGVEVRISDIIEEATEDEDEPWFEDVGPAFTREESEDDEDDSPLFEDVAGEELDSNISEFEEDSLQMPLAFAERDENHKTENDLKLEDSNKNTPTADKSLLLKRGLAFGTDGAIIFGTILLFIYSGLFILKSKALISNAGLPMDIITSKLLVPTILIALAISSAYFTFFHGSTGQTPGKMLFGLRVVGVNNEAITMGKSFLRWFGYIVSFIPLMGGFLLALGDKKSQALHDKIADTLVVELRPKDIEEDISELPLEEGRE